MSGVTAHLFRMQSKKTFSGKKMSFPNASLGNGMMELNSLLPARTLCDRDRLASNRSSFFSAQPLRHEPPDKRWQLHPPLIDFGVHHRYKYERQQKRTDQSANQSPCESRFPLGSGFGAQRNREHANNHRDRGHQNGA